MNLVKEEIRRKDYDLKKNIICIYQNEICVNGEVFDNSGGKILKDIVDSYTQNRKIKRKKKNIVFIYDIFRLNGWIMNIQGKEIKEYNNTTHSIETDNFIYVEFKTFDGSISPRKLVKPYGLEDGPKSYIMYQFVKLRAEYDWNFGKNYSITHYNMKKFDDMFTEEEKLELHAEGNYHYLTKAVLDDIYKSSAKPNLKAVIIDKVIEDLLSYDIKSFYPATMCYLDDFPIGKVYEVDSSEDLLTKMWNSFKNKKWFLAIFESDNVLNDSAFKPEKVNGKNVYGLTLYDVAYFYLKKINVTSILGAPVRLYRCTKCGYLNKVFTDKIIECYNFKEDKNNSEVERHVKKIPLNTLYGYGMRKSLRDNKTSYYNFNAKPSYYIAPQISFHIVAYGRYYLERMKLKLSNVVYNDTDCIKTTDPNCHKIFEEENKRIKELLKNRGYDSTIGNWEFEGLMPRFIAFAPKCYMFETDETFVCKFAGCREKAIKEIKSFDEILLTKTVKNGKPLGRNRFADYTVGKDNYEEEI